MVLLRLLCSVSAEKSWCKHSKTGPNQEIPACFTNWGNPSGRTCFSFNFPDLNCSKFKPKCSLFVSSIHNSLYLNQQTPGSSGWCVNKQAVCFLDSLLLITKLESPGVRFLGFLCEPKEYMTIPQLQDFHHSPFIRADHQKSVGLRLVHGVHFFQPQKSLTTVHLHI